MIICLIRLCSDVRVSTYVPALNTAQNIAVLYAALGRADEAKQIFSRALRGFESVFGVSNRQCKDIAAALAALEVD